MIFRRMLLAVCIVILGWIVLMLFNKLIVDPIATKSTLDVVISANNDLNVLIYGKDGCRYCIMAQELLKAKNIKYELIQLANNLDLQKKLIDQTGQTTVPYIYINNVFIGGYTQLEEISRNGQLDMMDKTKIMEAL